MEIINEIVTTYKEYLWNITWQIFILIGILHLILLCFRNISPKVRYLFWCLILLRLCFPVSFLLPETSTNSFYFTSIPIPSFETVIGQNSENIPKKETTSGDKVTLSGDTKIFLIWIAVNLIILLLTMLQYYFLVHSKIRNYPEKLDLKEFVNSLCEKIGISKDISVYVSPTANKGPYVIGFIKPKIILPETIVNTWNKKELEPVLLHELSHIKRNDIVIIFFQALLQFIYLFHPLVWYINRKINQEREFACDDLALYHLNNHKKHYATTILKTLDEIQHRESLPFTCPGMIEKHKFLVRRIRRMLNKKYLGMKRNPRFLVGIIVVLLVFTMSVFAQPEENKKKAMETRKALSDAMKYFFMGKYKQSLEKYIWYHNNSLKYQKSSAASRLSFGLGGWIQLGKKYPPALVKFKQIRNSKTDLLLRGKGNKQLFFDVIAMNSYLKEDKKTLELFIVLDKKNPKLNQSVWIRIKDLIFQQKKLNLAAKYMRNLEKSLKDAKDEYDNKIKIGKELKDDYFFSLAKKMFAANVKQIMEIAVYTGKIALAEKIHKKALLIYKNKVIENALKTARKKLGK